MNEVLEPLFTSLPFPKDVSPENLLSVYRVALEGLSLDALKSVVMKVVKGIWPDPVKFCPRPPELASMVRSEERRLREMSTPRISHEPLPKASALAAAEKKNAHRRVIARNVELDDFKKGSWPVGATWVAILSTVFEADPLEDAGKRDVGDRFRAFQAHRAAVKSRVVAADERIDEDKAEYFRRILSLKDAPRVTDEQLGERNKRLAQIDKCAVRESAA